MFSEDCGFVNFPDEGPNVFVSNAGRTLIYLVAFDKRSKILPNISIKLPGTFVSDDILERADFSYDSQSSINKAQMENDFYDREYFPDGEMMSIDMITSICLGWSNFTYESIKRDKYWFATFKDLTNKGRELFYLIKKLHSDKEIRILTFNNI